MFTVGFFFLLLLSDSHEFAAETVVVVSREFINFTFMITMLLLIRMKTITEPKALCMFIAVQAISGALSYCLLPFLVKTLGVSFKVIVGLSVIVLAVSLSRYFYQIVFEERGARKEQLINTGDREEACVKIKEEYQLTEREGEILVQLSQGYTRKVIANSLFVRQSTLAAHTKAIYAKTGCHRKDQVIALVTETMAGNRLGVGD